VAVPVDVRLNVSTDVELTVTVLLRDAVSTSVPVPPVSVSPLLRLLEVDASKVSAALPPLIVLIMEIHLLVEQELTYSQHL
jgi:hypothetical protein